MSCLRLFIVLLTLLSGGFVHASLLPFGDAPRASDEELDRMRGGFVVSFNGLEFLMPFSIDGIERLTQINGQTFINGVLVSPRVNPQALAPLHSSQISVNVQPPQTPVVDTTAGGSGGTGLPGHADTGSSAENGNSSPSGDSTAGGSGTPETGGNAPPVTTAGSSSGPQVTTNGSLIIIQNGAANTVVLPPNVSLDSLATYIQNSVNNQVIRNVTTLNLTVQSQMLAAQARLNAVLNQSLNGLR